MPLDVLELRVLQEDARRERPHHRDVDVLVDRRGDEEPAVLPVVGRQVGAAAAERDAKRTAGDDHESRLLRCDVTKDVMRAVPWR